MNTHRNLVVALVEWRCVGSSVVDVTFRWTAGEFPFWAMSVPSDLHQPRPRPIAIDADAGDGRGVFHLSAPDRSDVRIDLLRSGKWPTFDLVGCISQTSGRPAPRRAAF